MADLAEGELRAFVTAGAHAVAKPRKRDKVMRRTMR